MLIVIVAVFVALFESIAVIHSVWFQFSYFERSISFDQYISVLLSINDFTFSQSSVIFIFLIAEGDLME
jgi:hypothetical protein